jgi:hypothetical protein
MIDSKLWYQSMTLWGAVVAGTSAILNAAGVPVSDAEQQQVAETLTHLGELVGLGLVVWGRLRARHGLTTVGGGSGIALALVTASALTLSACEGTQLADPRGQLLTACESFVNAETALAGWRRAGVLSAEQIAAVDQARAVAVPVCSGPAPTSDAAAGTALDQVEAALLRVQSITPDGAAR